MYKLGMRQSEPRRQRPREAMVKRLDDLAERLGMPAVASWVHITSKDEFKLATITDRYAVRKTATAWKWPPSAPPLSRYRVELFGLYIPPPAQYDEDPDWPWPYLKIADAASTERMWVQLWLQCVREKGSSVQAQITWHPERGESPFQISYAQTAKNPELIRARQGLDIWFNIVRRGKQPGSGMMWDTKGQMETDILALMAGRLQTNDRITKTAVMSSLCDPKTFRDNLIHHKLNYRELKKRAEERHEASRSSHDDANP